MYREIPTLKGLKFFFSWRNRVIVLELHVIHLKIEVSVSEPRDVISVAWIPQGGTNRKYFISLFKQRLHYQYQTMV